MPPGKTITGPYYAQLMFKLRVVIRLKRWGQLSLGSRLLHDNAPLHKSVIVQQAICNCEFHQLNHTDYSQDLGPSDYFLYRNPKFLLRGTWFTDAESLKVVVEAWLDRQHKKIFFQGSKSLEGKWKECTDVAEEHSEKWEYVWYAALRFCTQIAKLFDRPL